MRLQVRQKAANTAVYVARQFFDRVTGYNLENMDERKWLRRFLFLETVAGRLQSYPLYIIALQVTAKHRLHIMLNQ